MAINQRLVDDLWETAIPFAQATAPQRQLNPSDTAAFLAVLVGLVILGLALMVLAWLGGRATRRYMASGNRRRMAPANPDDWSKKPLNRDTDLGP